MRKNYFRTIHTKMADRHFSCRILQETKTMENKISECCRAPVRLELWEWDHPEIQVCTGCGHACRPIEKE